MIDIKELQKELLEDHYNQIKFNINSYFDKQQSFILRDLLEDGQNNHYYIHMTKGILLPLIDLGYIKLIGTYNGYKCFSYLVLKQIK